MATSGSCSSCGCARSAGSTTTWTNGFAAASAQHASPHHVPKRIVQVADIPRTISGKISELAVREVIHGRPVSNVDALANPDALELFRGLRELES